LGPSSSRVGSRPEIRLLSKQQSLLLLLLLLLMVLLLLLQNLHIFVHFAILLIVLGVLLRFNHHWSFEEEVIMFGRVHG